MDIGEAVRAAKAGKRVADAGWNGSGQYVYYVPPASYPAQTEIAKAEFGEMVPYRGYLALKTAQGDVATWAPSCSDALSENWVVVGEEAAPHAFRKKPVVIEAFRWEGHAAYRPSADPKWFREAIDAQTAYFHTKTDGELVLVVRTNHGVADVHRGDWVIRQTTGEIYPCQADIFAQSYEAA